MSEFSRSTFRESELVKVDLSNCVIHATVGPLMDVESIETMPDGTQRAICRPYGSQRVEVFPVACLRRLVPYMPEAVDG